MKVAIIGAGLTGITTAYQLAKYGCDVTVFEQQSFAAAETSYANGGQISISQPFPWNSPDVPLKILKWFGRKDAPLVLKFQKDPQMWMWALRFLLNANSRNYYQNASKILRLALFSKETLREMVADENLNYNQQTRGIIKVFTSKNNAKEAVTQAKWLKENGVTQTRLDRNELEILEPALCSSTAKILGGTYTEIDESGDAHLFAMQLADRCNALGVKFHYNTKIAKLITKQGSISALKDTNGNDYQFDKYVLCAGSNGRSFSKDLKLSLPIYPVKGYSVTIPVGPSNSAPITSITDMDNHVVMSRLGNYLRAAGTAEINGYKITANKTREDMVLDSVAALFPNAGDFENAERWCGARPMTPDGVPLIGSTKYSNFFLNTGHGHLGWTLCSGSAKLISEHILNMRTTLDISAYSVDRF